MKMVRNRRNFSVGEAKEVHKKANEAKRESHAAETRRGIEQLAFLEGTIDT